MVAVYKKLRNHNLTLFLHIIRNMKLALCTLHLKLRLKTVCIRKLLRHLHRSAGSCINKHPDRIGICQCAAACIFKREISVTVKRLHTICPCGYLYLFIKQWKSVYAYLPWWKYPCYMIVRKKSDSHIMWLWVKHTTVLKIIGKPCKAQSAWRIHLAVTYSAVKWKSHI